jgi:hypothetical protein
VALRRRRGRLSKRRSLPALPRSRMIGRRPFAVAFDGCSITVTVSVTFLLSRYTKAIVASARPSVSSYQFLIEELQLWGVG